MKMFLLGWRNQTKYDFLWFLRRGFMLATLTHFQGFDSRISEMMGILLKFDWPMYLLGIRSSLFSRWLSEFLLSHGWLKSSGRVLVFTVSVISTVAIWHISLQLIMPCCCGRLMIIIYSAVPFLSCFGRKFLVELSFSLMVSTITVTGV